MKDIFIEVDKSIDLSENEINKLLRKEIKQDNVSISVKSLKYLVKDKDSKKYTVSDEGNRLVISKRYVSEDGFTPEKYEEIIESFDDFSGSKEIIERDGRMYEVIEMPGPLPYPDKTFTLITEVIGIIKKRLFIKYKNRGEDAEN